MSQRSSLVFGLVILMAAGAYFWWRGQAEQKITRKVDLFVETVEFEKLSLTTPEERALACEKIFAAEVILDAPSPTPSGTYSEKEMIANLHKFHGYITFFKITEEDRWISLDGDTAQVTLSGSMRVAAGPNWSETLICSIIMGFGNSSEGWEIETLSVVAE